MKTKNSVSALLPLMLTVSLAAQTTKPVARRPATTAHRAAPPVAAPCPVALPAISAKIPALAKPAECAKSLYSLAYVDTEIGTGELAQTHKYYAVHYTGYLVDGTKFDSSLDHPGAEPIVFPYGARQVIPGWDTGFEGMRVGGKRRLFIPYQLAYGEAGRPPIIPAKSELIFDVQLVSQTDTAPAPKPSPTPATAPGDAAKPALPAGTTTPPSGTQTPPPTPPADATKPVQPKS